MAKCPDCGGNLSEISSKFSRCDGCGKIWWNNNPAISAEKPSEKAVRSSPVRGGAGAGSAPAKEASEEKREAKVEKISGRKASDSKSAEQREIEELRARLQAMEERTVAQERSRYDTKAKRDKTSFKNTPAYEVARKWGLKVILPIFLILIALITLLSCFCGLRGIYVNVDNPNEFYSFTATKYEYHGTLFGEEYVDKGTWKKSDGKLELTYKDEFFGKITDSYEFSIKDSYKIITVTDDFGIEREYKRVSLMAYSTPQKVTVKFHINDGSENADIKRVDLGARVAEPEAPVRNGYEFMGWYTDKEGWRNGEGEQFSENDRVWEKTEYYANWKSTTEFSLTGDFIKETLKFKEGADLKALYAANVTNELLKGEWEIIFVQAANEDNVVDGSLAPAANVVARLVSVVIPDSVTSIGERAFSGCKGLTSVTIGNSVTSIGSEAFYKCTGLTSVTIGNSVTSIGSDAFYGCTNLMQKENGVSYVDTWAISCDTSISELTLRSNTVGIGERAFLNCTGLTSVVITDSVTSIGEGAFSGCSTLESITIPFVGAEAGKTSSDTYQYPFGYIFGTSSYTGGTGITQWYYGNSTSSSTSSTYYIPSSLRSVTVRGGNILHGAFRNCSMLTSVNMPETLANIGSYAFSDCTGLTSVTIGDSVTSIGDYAFSGCSGLTSVTIPDSVTSIGSYAFSGCSGMTSVSIPDGVTSIGSYEFSGCSGLTSVTIPDGVTSIGSYAFGGCTGLTEINWNAVSVADLGSIVFRFAGRAGNGITVTFGESVEVIPASLFDESGSSYRPNIKSVTIGSNVTSIGGIAFRGCSGLTSVTIPDGVTSIGGAAFSGCSGLTSVTIGDGVTSIGGDAFFGCTGLTEINWNAVSVENFNSNSNVFYNAGTAGEGIAVTFGDGVEKIPAYLFYVSTSSYRPNIKSVVIGSNVTSIGSYAFAYCSGLTSVTIPDGVTSIGGAAFSGCSGLTEINWNAVSVANLGDYVFSNAGTAGDGITVTFGESVEKIPAYAFYWCRGLTSVTIGDSVTSIGNSAFRDCTGLTSVIIGEGVTSIGNSAFRDCTGLTSVTIGNSVTSIGDYAFSGCCKLVEVYNKSSLDIKAGSSGNGGVGYYAKHVYTEENGSWLTYTDELYCFLYDGAKGYLVSYYGEATAITLPESFIAYDGTTVNTYEINQYAFYGNTLTSVTIGDSVTSIGDYAFEDCTGLTSVTIPDSVTSIGSFAFEGCTGLTSVTIGNSVASIGMHAFRNCTGLTSLTIPDSVTSIGRYAFQNCTKLTSVTIGNSVRSIGSYAFYNCTGLTSVYYTGDIAGWCGILFEDSAANPLRYAGDLYIDGQLVTDLVIPDSVTKINAYAFYNCTGLSSVVFEDTEGWQASKYSYFGSYTTLSSANLANTSTAATYLNLTYCGYFWRKVK